MSTPSSRHGVCHRPEITNAQRHRAGLWRESSLTRENRFVSAGQFDLLSRERDLPMFLHVDKCRAFKMGIARRFTCPYSPSLDRGLNGSRARVRRCEDSGAVDICEMAADQVTIM